MDDPIEQCGNDLRFIEWWLIHHGKQIGDPADRQFVSELAQLTQGVVQVLVSRQLSNRGLSREFEAESARVLTSAAGRLANANQFAAA